MFLVNWFSGILNWLGLGNKRAKILFLGLDNAGKTTLLHMLKEKKVAQLEPTQHPHDEELTMGNLKFRVHDLGGHDVARELWQDYFTAVNAIVYLVDCNDRERFTESKAELDKLLSNDQLQGIPILVLGNKIDMQRAASEAELRQALGLQPYLTGKGKKVDLPKGMRPMELFMVSVIKRMGYREGFQWVAQYID
mmetsp:Transcript_12825/g.20160  ORF Transcript_12825/g.20160 Transcript_12825/m.20160 type:complete len:194 (-) Transcript_12825:43-624(-)|eukprot:CAMPEP_0184287868 /NCGR_PEP_ID=MMETSP1049-20130417/275_1 /TAXON_ID=77928 /ORGANISM="Proteomonas sulcata, Strain CCMP704" /LENGTH=193 /DNA_ID=CAMNT_0026593965 /DNA_START=132 /DNA_END=713 /DNA_ORIENTATION=+